MTYTTTIQRLATITTVSSVVSLLLINLGGYQVASWGWLLAIISLPAMLVFRHLAHIAREDGTPTGPSRASAVGAGLLAILENMPEEPEEPEEEPSPYIPPCEMALDLETDEYEIVAPIGFFDYEVSERHGL